VPNVIADKNLYDEIEIESGKITCQVLCKNDEISIRNALTKFIMMLEAYDKGYVDAIKGNENGLSHVFCVKGYPRYRRIGGGAIELQVDILTLIYNSDMHMAVINDCLSAGANTVMCPDNRRYFDVELSNAFIKNYASDSYAYILDSQKNSFRKSIVGNMRPL